MKYENLLDYRRVSSVQVNDVDLYFNYIFSISFSRHPKRLTITTEGLFEQSRVVGLAQRSNTGNLVVAGIEPLTFSKPVPNRLTVTNITLLV